MFGLYVEWLSGSSPAVFKTGERRKSMPALVCGLDGLVVWFVRLMFAQFIRFIVVWFVCLTFFDWCCILLFLFL